ncbi:MAG: hypothetical protein RRX93_08355 [Bacteroidales bacterium]
MILNVNHIVAVGVVAIVCGDPPKVQIKVATNNSNTKKESEVSKN